MMFHLVVTCVGSKNYEGPSIKNAITNLIHRGTKNDVEELFKEWKIMLVKHMKSLTFLPKDKMYIKVLCGMHQLMHLIG